MNTLIVLLICVPLQFALITYKRPAETYVLGLIHSWSRKLIPWKDYFIRMLKASLEDFVQDSAESEIPNDVGEDHNSDISTVRSSRPDQVQFRVGEVVVNTKLAFIGIIIGWQFEEGEEPVYEILTDHSTVTDYKTKSLQKDLLRMENILIYHSESKKYFEYFDDNKSQYVRRHG